MAHTPSRGMRLLLLWTYILLVGALPGDTLSIWSYNIMNGGFADKWDRDNRIPGNLTDFIAGQSKHIDVLGLVETHEWRIHSSYGHLGYLEIAKSFGFEHVFVRDNCALMSHLPMKILEQPSEGINTIVAEIGGVVYIVTYMTWVSFPDKWKGFDHLSTLVRRYSHVPTVLMGDLNSISPLDRSRYNETLLCGKGAYNSVAQSGEYISEFCVRDGSGWKLDFKPMQTLLSETDLIDLCFLGGGFYDEDTDVLQATSQCGFSNPTLMLHMTAGSRAHDRAMAKIDYILANRRMQQEHRFHHSTVVRTFQADGASDHYPIEATFLGRRGRKQSVRKLSSEESGGEVTHLWV